MRNLKTVLWVLAVCAAGFLFFRRGLPEQKPAQAAETNPAGCPETVVPPAPAVLIQGGEETDIPWTSRTPAAKRVRKIFPDPAWMTPDPVLKVGDRIELALFEDAVFDADISNVTRYPNGSVGMTAQLFGNATGTLYLSYSGGRMLATVEVLGDSDYAVLACNGTHYAVEIDRINSEVFEGLPPRVPDVVLDNASNAVPAAVGNVIGAPADSMVIDVMFVYTPAASAWADEYRSGITNVMNLAMERANEVHANSDTRVYLHRVHDAEVDYVESTASTNNDVDLDSLTYMDGVIDNVHSLRDEYAVDLVCMLAFVTNYGGYGYVLDNTNGLPNFAFCVARVQQAWDSTYTVVHEWGHNMGCHHSKTQKIQVGPTAWDNWPENTWSAGWQWADPYPPAAYGGDYVGYCSVMTYADIDNDKKPEYIRVPHFSNPLVNYTYGSTQATGDAANGDNARTIRNTRAVISAYREALDMDYDGLPNTWELQYFGGKTNANPAVTASNGVNTVIEAYVAGISPVDPAAFFKVNTFETPVVFGNGFVIGWNATSGRVYSVHWATNLVSSFQPLETNIVWPQASYTDTVYSIQPNGFYNVKVQLAE